MGRLSWHCGQGKPLAERSCRLQSSQPHQWRLPCAVLGFFRVQNTFQVQNGLADAWGSVPSAEIHANTVLSFPPHSEPDMLFTPLSPLELFGELC